MDPVAGEGREHLRELLAAAYADAEERGAVPAAARYRSARRPSDLELRLEVLAGTVAPVLARAAVFVLLLAAVGSIAIAPAVAHDLGLTGATGEVGGTVLSPDGSPLAGASVRILPPSETRFWWAASRLVAETDAEGRFRLRAVPAGMVGVRATAVGHVPQTIADVEIRVGAATEAAFVLATVGSPGAGETATVRGKVRDRRTGSAIADARVFVFTPGGDAGAAAVTGADGTFQFAMPAGEVYLGATASGYGADVTGPHRLAVSETLDLELSLGSVSVEEPKPEQPAPQASPAATPRPEAIKPTPTPALRWKSWRDWSWSGSSSSGGSWGGWRTDWRTGR